jgi:hypothetical protein
MGSRLMMPSLVVFPLACAVAVLLPFEFNYVMPDEMLHYVTGNHKDLVVIGIDQVSAVRLALA